MRLLSCSLAQTVHSWYFYFTIGISRTLPKSVTTVHSQPLPARTHPRTVVPLCLSACTMLSQLLNMRPISVSLANSAYRALRIAPTASLETSTILPPDPAIEEEQIADYNPHDFYPANPGDLLNKRYKTIVKLGWGSCSTVWLARDVKR